MLSVLKIHFAGRLEISDAVWLQHDAMIIANATNTIVRFISLGFIRLFS
jgi:hypothetical protein